MVRYKKITNWLNCEFVSIVPNDVTEYKNDSIAFQWQNFDVMQCTISYWMLQKKLWPLHLFWMSLVHGSYYDYYLWYTNSQNNPTFSFFNNKLTHITMKPIIYLIFVKFMRLSRRLDSTDSISNLYDGSNLVESSFHSQFKWFYQ